MFYVVKCQHDYVYDNVAIWINQKGSPTAKCKETSRLKFGDIIG